MQPRQVLLLLSGLLLPVSPPAVLLSPAWTKPLANVKSPIVLLFWGTPIVPLFLADQAADLQVGDTRRPGPFPVANAKSIWPWLLPTSPPSWVWLLLLLVFDPKPGGTRDPRRSRRHTR